MATIRLNRYLAQAGLGSRRAADELIKSGRVFLNGQKAVLGEQVNEGDTVKVNNRLIKPLATKVYLAYHKPVGIICTADPNSSDNIIKAVNYPERIFPVGRLDVHSSGLIFLTNDGDFANRLTHPKFWHAKEYQVKVDQLINEQFINSLKRGVKLQEGVAKGDKVERLNNHEFKITIHQGWNRQIRRMCEVLGSNVRELKRIRVGSFDLGDLPVGKWRKLTAKEIKEFI
ncbi:MAG: pseudouridine synthase [Candidatus Komeilibacteria bacterium]|nr:pseudouridine synthase [Candidatus Komeilibacteria bacterium]